MLNYSVAELRFKIKFNHSIIVFNDYHIGGYTIGDINLCIRFMYQVTYS